MIRFLAGRWRCGWCASWTARSRLSGPRVSSTCPIQTLPVSHTWWIPHVERLAELGVTAGCAASPARFCPYAHVDRQQMAALLVAAFKLPSAGDAGFLDVAADNGFRTQIDAIHAAGITAGCATNPRRFCPANTVTRDQMATFLNRARKLGGEGAATSQTDAFEPTSGYEVISRLTAVTPTNPTIYVYYCAEPGTDYDIEDLDVEVEFLQDKVGEFFLRETSGQLRLNLFSQGIVTPSLASVNSDWQTITLDYLSTNYPTTEENPCFVEVKKDIVASKNEFLVIADMDPGDVAGYAYYGGASIAIDRNRYSNLNSANREKAHLYTIAHELGHKLLSLCHPHQSSRRPKTHKNFGECAIDEAVHGVEYHANQAPLFQQYHDMYIYDPIDTSVMSYKFSHMLVPISSYEFGDEFIGCRQLHIKEYDTTGCMGAKITDPNSIIEPEHVDVPSPPQSLAATDRDRAVYLTWESPMDNGGAAVTGYNLSLTVHNPDGSVGVTEYLPSTSDHSRLVEGLVNGVTYTFEVQAENTAGQSEAARVSATPRRATREVAVPGPVRSLAVEGGSHLVALTWSPPLNDGGLPITGYNVVYRRENSPSWHAWSRDRSETTATITGLDAGVPYEFEVTARNSLGTGAPTSIFVSTRRVSVDLSLEPKYDPTNCSQDKSCHDFVVELTGFDSGAYTLECWSEGRMFRSSSLHYGRISRGECFTGLAATEVWVVVDGIESNHVFAPERRVELTLEPKYDPERCDGQPACYDFVVELEEFALGSYGFECWSDGSQFVDDSVYTWPSVGRCYAVEPGTQVWGDCQWGAIKSGDCSETSGPSGAGRTVRRIQRRL